MRSLRNAILAGGGLALLLGVVAVPARGAQAGRATTSPSPSASENFLSRVSAVSSGNAWAVGTYRNDMTGALDTLILHWNGRSWARVKSPSPSSVGSGLDGVSALSRGDAWAVGNYTDAVSHVGKTLVLHWNGRKWSRVATPSPGSAGLSAVRTLSPGNAWAVGGFANGPVAKTLIEHWNGRRWSRVKSPSPSSDANGLNDVSAVSAGDVWAAGFFNDSMGASDTLIEHWNGRSWSHVKSPNPSSAENALNGVGAASPSNAWAVGGYTDGPVSKTLIEHWNGRRWSQVTSPNPSSTQNDLSDVSVVSSRNAWAVGNYRNDMTGATDTLILHWNGKRWSQVASPSPSILQNDLDGVDVVSRANVWTVGSFHNDTSNATDTLILHWNGHSWS